MSQNSGWKVPDRSAGWPAASREAQSAQAGPGQPIPDPLDLGLTFFGPVHDRFLPNYGPAPSSSR